MTTTTTPITTRNGHVPAVGDFVARDFSSYGNPDLTGHSNAGQVVEVTTYGWVRSIAVGAAADSDGFWLSLDEALMLDPATVDQWGAGEPLPANIADLTDADLAARYHAACAASVRHYDMLNAAGQAAADAVTDALVAEIHRRWDGGAGPHLSI